MCIMKKLQRLGSMILGFVACFAMVVVVSALGTRTLGYKEYERVTVDSMGSSFSTSIYVSSVSGTPTIKTQVGRKMLGMMWIDTGSTTQSFSHGGVRSTSSWKSTGSSATRATWTNLTSGTSITANFSLY